MGYLIDTDWVIDHLANVPEANELVMRLADEGIAVSIITFMEAYEGLLRSPAFEEQERLFRAFTEAVPIIPLSITVARCCAQLRKTLRRQRKRVNSRALDLLIAATALEHDLTLVTRNIEDYNDIPGLRLYQGG